MELLQELQDQIRAFVEERSSLSSLRRWLAGHVQVIQGRGGLETQDLSASTWSLLSELDSRERDEAGVRRALAKLLRSQPSAAAPTAESVPQP